MRFSIFTIENGMRIVCSEVNDLSLVSPERRWIMNPSVKAPLLPSLGVALLLSDSIISDLVVNEGSLCQLPATLRHANQYDSEAVNWDLFDVDLSDVSLVASRISSTFCPSLDEKIRQFLRTYASAAQSTVEEILAYDDFYFAPLARPFVRAAILNAVKEASIPSYKALVASLSGSINGNLSEDKYLRRQDLGALWNQIKSFTGFSSASQIEKAISLKALNLLARTSDAYTQSEMSSLLSQA